MRVMRFASQVGPTPGWASAFLLLAAACHEPQSAQVIPTRAGSKAPPPAMKRTESGFALDSDPSGATVYVDALEVGRTPIRVTDLKPGEHLIRLQADGYAATETVVQLSHGVDVIEFPRLQLVPLPHVERPFTHRPTEPPRPGGPTPEALRGPHRVRIEKVLPYGGERDKAQWTRRLESYRDSLLRCYRKLSDSSVPWLEFPAGEVPAAVAFPLDRPSKVMERSGSVLGWCVKAAFERKRLSPPDYPMVLQFTVVFERANARPVERATKPAHWCGTDDLEGFGRAGAF